MSRHPKGGGIAVPAAPAWFALGVVVAVLLALAPPAFAQDGPSPIISGPTTADAAVAWSQATFAAGSAPDVIIARDDTFPDALGAGAVQARLQAPLLLTNTTLLSPQTAAEIARLGAENAIILGGEAAVAPSVETALQALGLTTERVAGATRAQTAAAIVARFYPTTTEVVVARANAPEDNPTAAFADTVSLAGYSSVAGVPVLLTNDDVLLDETAAALASLPLERVVIAGGTAAISDDVAGQIAATIDDGNDATAESVDRIAGPSRSSTAIGLAGDLGYADASDAPRIILTSGEAGDAWAAGFASAVQAGNGAVTVLALESGIAPETAEYLDGAGVPLICGPGVTAEACDAAFEAISS